MDIMGVATHLVSGIDVGNRNYQSTRISHVIINKIIKAMSRTNRNGEAACCRNVESRKIEKRRRNRNAKKMELGNGSNYKKAFDFCWIYERRGYMYFEEDRKYGLHKKNQKWKFDVKYQITIK